MKNQLSKVYYKEKSQFEKLEQLKRSIQKKVDLEQHVERNKIQQIEQRRKNEDQAMKEVLERQREEIHLLKTAIQGEQEARMTRQHNQYISTIKRLEVEKKTKNR